MGKRMRSRIYRGIIVEDVVALLEARVRFVYASTRSHMCQNVRVYIFRRDQNANCRKTSNEAKTKVYTHHRYSQPTDNGLSQLSCASLLIIRNARTHIFRDRECTRCSETENISLNIQVFIEKYGTYCLKQRNWTMESRNRDSGSKLRSPIRNTRNA